MNASSAHKYFLFGFLIISVALMFLDTYIKTPVTPYGIVSFEFIGSQAKAEAALEQWGTLGQIAAAVSIGIDFLYLVCYAGAFYLMLKSLASKLEASQSAFSIQVAWAAYALPSAAFFDAIENIALASLLLNMGSDGAAQTAFVAASIKFSFLALALFVWLIGLYKLKSAPVEN